MSSEPITAEPATAHATDMNRRELLKRLAYLMGGAISAPVALSVLNGCAKPAGAEWKPAVLTPAQLDLVAEVTEIFIPRTDTPGAKDVGIPSFIDLMLKDALTAADRQRYLNGLTEFEAFATSEHGRSFTKLDPSVRTLLVKRSQDEAIANEPALAPGTRPQRPFILMTKELTLLGFFMSEPGSTQVLQYEAVPGAYHGCVPLTKAGKGRAWALDVSSPT
jgi:gluconate 2-dehydrogenase gamma chain